MRIFHKLLLVLAALVAVPGWMASAQAQGDAPQEGSYLNGGIGLDARHSMQAQRRHYNLHLSFARPHGEYIAGVAVTIERRGGKQSPVQYDDAGPLLYVQLPAGSYHITAVYEGRKRERTVSVGAQGVDVVLNWP